MSTKGMVDWTDYEVAYTANDLETERTGTVRFFNAEKNLESVVTFVQAGKEPEPLYPEGIYFQDDFEYDQSLQICNNATAFAVMSTQGTPGFTRKFIAGALMADGTRFTDKPGWETMQFVDEMAGRDPRLAAITVGPGCVWLGDEAVSAPDLGCSVTGYQVQKFVMDKTLPEWGRVDKSYNDMPVFRYAEVLLNYAEARAELGALTQEDLDNTVNKLRDRVGMTAHLNLEAANADPDPFLSGEPYGYRNVSGGCMVLP